MSNATSIPLSRTSTFNSATSELERKQRRLQLREFYGLQSGQNDDPLDIDLPNSFNAQLYFDSLSSSASLPELLKRENELLMEIRELDGERQSLVYNHHHELIEASDTIRKMKSRAESLDASLDSLKQSFQLISQLSTALSPPVSSLSLQTPLASDFPRSALIPLPSPTAAVSPNGNKRFSLELTSRGRSSSNATLTGPPTLISAPTLPTVKFKPLIHLPPLLSLPILLKSLLSPSPSSSSPATATTTTESTARLRSSSSVTVTNTTGGEEERNAHQLWGLWEPILKHWEDAGIGGVEEIGRSCREILRSGGR